MSFCVYSHLHTHLSSPRPDTLASCAQTMTCHSRYAFFISLLYLWMFFFCLIFRLSLTFWSKSALVYATRSDSPHQQVLVKLQRTEAPQLEGLQEIVIPISPISKSFQCQRWIAKGDRYMSLSWSISVIYGRPIGSTLNGKDGDRALLNPHIGFVLDAWLASLLGPPTDYGCPLLL